MVLLILYLQTTDRHTEGHFIIIESAQAVQSTKKHVITYLLKAVPLALTLDADQVGKTSPGEGVSGDRSAT